MKLGNLPKSHPQSFRRRFGSRYGGLIDPSFLLGYDPFEDHPLIGMNRRPFNIRKDEEYYEIELPVPGYKREEISIHIESDVLTVRGQKEEDSERDSTYIVKEHGTESFEQAFTLGKATDQDKISARFSNGILYIRLNHIKDKETHTKPKDIRIS